MKPAGATPCRMVVIRVHRLVEKNECDSAQFDDSHALVRSLPYLPQTDDWGGSDDN